MKKMWNQVTLSGFLYSHSLKTGVTGKTAKNPDMNYITGMISVATDAALTNIVDIRYSFVPERNDKGANPLYSVLNKIIKGELGTIMGDNLTVETAVKLSINTSFNLNEYYTTDATGNEVLSSRLVNEGGFVHVVKKLDDSIDKRNLFDVDMLVNKIRVVDGDPEAGTNDKVELEGYIFNFKNNLLPTTFIAELPAAINYFSSLEVSQKKPKLIHLKGRQASLVVVKKQVEENAFGGEAFVREVKSFRKANLIHWAGKEDYDISEDSTVLTPEDIKTGLANREVYLSEMKARRTAYLASKNGGTVTTKAPVSDIDDSAFDF